MIQICVKLRMYKFYVEMESRHKIVFNILIYEFLILSMKIIGNVYVANI